MGTVRECWYTQWYTQLVQQAGVRQPIIDCAASNEPPKSPAGPDLAFTKSAQGRVGKWLGCSWLWLRRDALVVWAMVYMPRLLFVCHCNSSPSFDPSVVHRESCELEIWAVLLGAGAYTFEASSSGTD